MSDSATFRGTWRSPRRGIAPASSASRSCASRRRQPGTGGALRGPPDPSKVRTFMSPPSPPAERLEPAASDDQLRFRLRKLLSVARSHKRALVLTHDNPDPDAVASACGLSFLLEHGAHVHAQAAYGGIIGRAENKALLKVLHLPIQPVGRVEASQFDLVCLVDTQPEVGNYSLAARSAPELVIDHHPARPASLLSAFHDVGGPAGATSTLVTQYLRAARLVPGPALATALFYGIKSDTRDLGREVEGADVECYNWLFPHVDKQALSRIEHPQVPARYFAAYHTAYERARLHGNGQACVVDLGEGYVPEVCSAFGGSAGGHGAMAGARIPLDGRIQAELAQELAAAFLKVFHLRAGVGTPLVPQP